MRRLHPPCLSAHRRSRRRSAPGVANAVQAVTTLQLNFVANGPASRTTLPRLAALLWIKLPGESDGICGGETTYLFSPTQARRLISNSSTVPEAERQQAAAAQISPTTDRTAA